jgi:hypothetical protein
LNGEEISSRLECSIFRSLLFRRKSSERKRCEDDDEKDSVFMGKYQRIFVSILSMSNLEKREKMCIFSGYRFSNVEGKFCRKSTDTKQNVMAETKKKQESFFHSFSFRDPSEIHHRTNLLCFQGFVYVSNSRNHR